jgi:hypothetical protein
MPASALAVAGAEGVYISRRGEPLNEMYCKAYIKE